ncbi:preprotein translocase subunit SecG [Candidatus Gracilibacteria bacterium HOT-871]|nr:preprotein translocase subunit SecG [Candidatus Gracilibacteria bacterium HOT-871]MBB1564975.1 preprotein translocase subunit SecG [Candidatus Gracilibacteria bacterium]MBF0913625.1 preprotein translocase subunit SecG [Candidatus Gracilibacteria bacterium]RKW22532.1 MAG: preprotein translocase subunit SecG [Candidatus Gracilibacteria bacterium]
MIEILKFIEIAVAVCLILVVLIQNKGTALNLNTMSGGMNEITRRGPEKVLHNITVVLGIIFIFNSASLFILR